MSASDQQLQALEDRLDFGKKLQALTNKIHATDNVWQIMLDLSAEICELFQCERLTLYVVNKEKGVLVSKIKTGIDSDKELVLPINRQSIAGYVALTRSTVRIDDLEDPEQLHAIDPELRFFAKVDGVTGFKSKEMLAAPLLQGISKELVGVLQLINQRVDGRFDKVAEEGLEALTATLALALFQRIKATALLPKRYEVLASAGVISAPELELAQRWAQRKNKDLEKVLVEDFQVPLAAIGKALAKQANLPYQACDRDWRVNPELRKKINRAECERLQWLPFSLEQTRLTVVIADPENRLSKESIHRSFPYNEILLRYTTPTDFKLMLEQYFPAGK
jgi:hypothetical protein